MAAELKRRTGLTPGDIDVAFVTHEHGDHHVGLPNFPNAKWLAGAEETRGSWWPNWNAWLEGFSGGERAARKKLGNAKYKPVEPAPGGYVKVRV